MSPIRAVQAGTCAVNKTKRMWFVFWFYNLLFALAIALPASALLWRNLGHSLYARQMFGDLQLQWISEFLFQTRGWPVVMLVPLSALVALGYLLLGTFLAGGALTLFAAPERVYRPGVFYQGCGRNFGRLFRLLLYSLVFYGLVVALNVALAALGQHIWRDSMEERPVLIFSWSRAGLILLLLLLVNMIFDYAKIRLVVEDSRKSLRAAFGSIKLVAQNLGRTAATYLIVTVLAVLFFLVFRGVSVWLPENRIRWLLLLLLLQQAYVFSRIWVRLLFFASQTEMSGALRKPPQEPVPTPAPVAAPEPQPAEGAQPLLRSAITQSEWARAKRGIVELVC